LALFILNKRELQLIINYDRMLLGLQSIFYQKISHLYVNTILHWNQFS
jgi:hypothetical protein